MSIAPIAALPPVEGLLAGSSPLASISPGHASMSFSQMIQAGIDNVNAKVAAADQAVRSFVLDDSIPVHQVSFALEQARLSLELMTQVRGRLVEGYQQLMQMQL
jgi:flagellar hook-basal body complex protein FliE